MNASRIPGTRRARAPLSLRTYAGWMGGQDAAGRVYRLLPSEVPLPGFAALDPPALKSMASRFESFPAGPQLTRSPHGPSRAARISLVARILGGWKKSLSLAAKSAGEPQWLDALAGAEVYPLVRQLSTRQLLETRRKARLGDLSGARERAVDLLEECGRFLSSLEERAVNAQ